jgi:hypothetical protein
VMHAVGEPANCPAMNELVGPRSNRADGDEVDDAVILLDELELPDYC